MPPRRLGSSSRRSRSSFRWSSLSRPLTLAGLALVPVLVLGLFFVLPVSGMLARGFWPDGGFDPIGVLEVLARPRVHRVVWFTVWSASVATAVSLLLGLPAAHALHRLEFRGRQLVRAALLVPFVLPTVVVGVAFRELLGESGPLGFLGLDGTPVAIVAGLVFFNVAVVIRAVGAAWASLDPRPGRAAPRSARAFQVFRTVTLPALRPAIVSSASVVFLFCATSFGVVLTLGGLRYASVETEIYLLPRTCSTSRPPRRCRCCNWSRSRPAGHRRAAARRTRSERGARRVRPAARDAVTGRRSPPRSCCSSRWRRSRHWSPARCRSATAGGTANYRALTTTGSTRRCSCRSRPRS